MTVAMAMATRDRDGDGAEAPRHLGGVGGAKEGEERAPDSTSGKSLQGMKKWIGIYRAKRPGLEVLQREIDQWMAEYDAREEQARRERGAAETEEGWTVVVGKTGRKKTTDDTGIAVGAVAVAAAEERAKKKRKADITLDFYRFQRHEVRRNEVLELQQRFQADKKRIAQLKAARKFRPF